MGELTQWLRHEREGMQLHPLLITAEYTVVFLEVHRFQDVNG
jgi:hypothetical protein